MRIIIAGSRSFEDYDLLCHTMSKLIEKEKLKDIVILSGHAKGADLLGEHWAWKNRFPCEVYHAEWDRLGKKAGPVRNQEMVDKADALVAFWDGQSTGTLDVISRARKARLKVKVVRFASRKLKVKESK